MDRIQINGVWYVREDQAYQESIQLDPSNYHGCVVENDEFAIEATKLYDEDGDRYHDILDIKFTDKRHKPWKEETWDNNKWMNDVLNNVPASLADITNIGSNGVQFLQSFLKHLKKKEWL
jgi:hypothetical protein